MKSLRYCILALIIGLMGSCDGLDTTPDIDSKELRTNMGEEIILPSYKNFQSSLTPLKAAVDSFAQNSDSEHLKAVKTAFESAYITWQKASFYQFGPAEDALLRQHINNFPANTTNIDDNILLENVDLTYGNYTSKGFPALDYLLYGVATDEEGVLFYYQEDAEREKRLAYLQAIVVDMQNKIAGVINTWETSYLAKFNEASGTGTGSAIGNVVNAFVLHFERHLRDNKVGIPLGVRSFGAVQPDKAEGLYSGLSVTLASANIKAMHDFYRGVSTDNVNGLGFDDFMISLDQANLATEIDAQFNKTTNEINLIPSPYVENLEQGNITQADLAYDELKALLLLLKVDMTNALSVQITYQDNDGD